MMDPRLTKLADLLVNYSTRIQPGEHVTIAGPSGVGKTTLLTVILRFCNPTQGDTGQD